MIPRKIMIGVCVCVFDLLFVIPTYGRDRCAPQEERVIKRLIQACHFKDPTAGVYMLNDNNEERLFYKPIPEKIKKYEAKGAKVDAQEILEHHYGIIIYLINLEKMAKDLAEDNKRCAGMGYQPCRRNVRGMNREAYFYPTKDKSLCDQFVRENIYEFRVDNTCCDGEPEISCWQGLNGFLSDANPMEVLSCASGYGFFRDGEYVCQTGPLYTVTTDVVQTKSLPTEMPLLAEAQQDTGYNQVKEKE